ncbi:MAG: iron-containing alcohol dehydrogenase [Kiritimatiellae bacterium]|jgi:NADP-dependent alcohol dehydrogenase|nr:iron-containing alcohol dehydrogenase [Kiritimatiellia bacterium]MDD3585286.1 iron-containing alcohol dehydrogenase [Kiritimatiellia bacterium]HHU15435.1 iron-containing alcohol dehydrogenase [Lentisphaerota bacterium]HON47565.1 iron-containing alcohol dehydrogenase [Kiritimatiellia bacterium]HRT29188.1 iron-containing alcohol dehydrogenase [Kiritimatiellia bacterium]
MTSFTCYNPVKLVFGKGMIAELKDLIPPDLTVMLTYGGGSIKKNGVYDQVRAALADRTVVEFGGIEPNPRYETCMRAAELAKSEGVGFLLAVGGGSVLDATKFIAIAALYDAGDPWEIMEGRAPIEAAMPLGAVLTLPATGSEMNTNAVISRESTGEKLSFGSPHVYPQFSILDPETTYSLPERQTQNGIVDTFAHVMEQYMCGIGRAPLTERMAEAVLITLVEEAPKVKANPDDYEVRANLMWCATVGLNGWLGCGVAAQDWATHMIGHELTALYGIDHGRTLAVIMPAVHRHQLERKLPRLVQCAERVWGITQGEDKDRAAQAIDRMEAFFQSVGVPTRLSAYNVDADEAAPLVAERLARRGVKIGEYGDLGEQAVREIVMLAR